MLHVGTAELLRQVSLGFCQFASQNRRILEHVGQSILSLPGGVCRARVELCEIIFRCVIFFLDMAIRWHPPTIMS